MSADLGRQVVERVAEVFGVWAAEGAPLRVERGGGSVRLTPLVEGAGEVTVYDQGGDAMLTCQRWHTHFTDAEEAVGCAWWLMTPYTRVVHELKGGILAAVWVERFSVDGWEAEEPVYFLNPEYPPDWELGPGQSYFRRTHQMAVLPPPADVSGWVEAGLLDEDGWPMGSGDGEVEESQTARGPGLFG